MTDLDPKLDPIDWAILEILQRDCSLPIHAIAEQVGLSVNPCWRRMRRLEDAGIIAARVALVDPARVGRGTTVFVAIRTNRHDPEWLAAFSEGIAVIDEIVECHRMAGDVDYLLTIRVADISEYDRVYQQLIARVPSLADVTASFSMERLKHTTALPRPS